MKERKEKKINCLKKMNAITLYFWVFVIRLCLNIHTFISPKTEKRRFSNLLLLLSLIPKSVELDYVRKFFIKRFLLDVCRREIWNKMSSNVKRNMKRKNAGQERAKKRNCTKMNKSKTVFLQHNNNSFFFLLIFLFSTADLLILLN